MPEMTGLQLAARLRADGITMPIVLTTGLLCSSIITQAAGLGIEEILEKPEIGEDVLKVIETVRDG